MKIQEVISNIVITDKYGKLCQSRDTRTQGAFSDNFTPDIDGFTDEPVVQCDVQIVENTFIDHSK